MISNVGWTQAHLDRVSRSFSFCIAQLPEPLRHWTAISYLMCRVLDTIEDAPWSQPQARWDAYQAFDGFVGKHPAPAAVLAWAELLPKNIEAHERTLVSDAQRLFDDLAQLPPIAKEPIVQTVLEMSAGMRHYAQAQAEGGRLVLGCLAEVNRYCYFVAGTVGRLLTRLLVAHQPSFRPGPTLRKEGLHFGLFLQKVNLLKDQVGDEREGRFLVPDGQQVLASAIDNAAGALSYLAALPHQERGYRRFCAWSLIMGAASLVTVCSRWRGVGPGKLSRAETVLLLTQVEQVIDDDLALAALIQQQLDQLPKAHSAELAAKAIDANSSMSRSTWFTDLVGRFVQPPLHSSELAELHLA